jgi:DNA-directed RNA polymerase alpha subunit
MREAILKDGEEFMYRNPIEELNLERPIRNILIKNGIEFIDQLTNMKFEDLKRLRQLSPARARIVRLALKKLGYDFSESAV